VLATIGTGGQLFTPIDNPRFDPQLRTHTFCHVLPDQCYIKELSIQSDRIIS